MAKANKSAGEGIWDTIRTIVYAVLIALTLRTFAYEPFNIPSGSMLPTLLIGDYLFVSKFSYGYSRHSLPWGIIPFEGRVFGGEVERGDVAVFKLPADNRTDYIKRIVGLPGDRIQVVNGVLNINGTPVKRERVAESVVPGTAGTVTEYIETLPNGRRHLIWERSDDMPFVDNTPLYLVPEGHYFAMGDNRDFSQDSRAQRQVGFIPRENLVGRAEFLFFSYDGSARLWEVWKWPFAICWGRLFDGIQ